MSGERPVFTTSDYDSEPGKDFDCRLRYDPLPGFQQRQRMQGFDREPYMPDYTDVMDYRLMIDRLGWMMANNIDWQKQMGGEVADRLNAVIVAAKLERERLREEMKTKYGGTK